MQLASVGRNEPCPCGSGRKHKKCCLGAPDVVAAAGPAELDVAALVDRAIADDEWEPVYEVFDAGFALFEPMQPLEHVRFPDDVMTSSRMPDPAELARMCGGGWLRWCELEICDVLARHELDPGERDGLRLAVHLLRRFGAQSPVVESIAELQADERTVRARKLAEAMSRRGLTMEDLERFPVEAMRDWVERAHPALLPFADWIALRVMSEDDAKTAWRSGIAARVCDVLLYDLENAEIADARERAYLAAVTMRGAVPVLGLWIADRTPARVSSDDERAVHDAIYAGDAMPPASVLPKIVDGLEARRDFAGASLLRSMARRAAASTRSSKG